MTYQKKGICINFDIAINNAFIQWYSIFNIFCISPQVFKFGISEYFIYVMWSRFSTYFSFISTPFSYSFCFLCIYITEKIQNSEWRAKEGVYNVSVVVRNDDNHTMKWSYAYASQNVNAWSFNSILSNYNFLQF